MGRQIILPESSEAAVKRASFFAHILMLSAYVVLPSWEVLIQSLTTFTIPPELAKSRDSR
jgi:hypothetical protein